MLNPPMGDSTGYGQPVDPSSTGFGTDSTGMVGGGMPGTDSAANLIGGEYVADNPPQTYRDDLTIIEGIGTKIAELFYSYNINTFSDLASTAPDQLRQIMATDFAAHDPSTWPDQAQMAATGDWDGLRAWQEQLQGGRVVGPADDLTLIEGVGPKIAETLAANGVMTFGELASRTPATISAILGPEFASHDPTTWPQQAQMAAAGQWDQLRAWQDELDGGRIVDTGQVDDLTIVEGIGPKISEVLNAAGINRWTQLAATSAEQIADILARSDGSFGVADPTTWPQQAQMAADGLFEELRAWQEQLDGGKE